jgi:hypothetical protein
MVGTVRLSGGAGKMKRREASGRGGRPDLFAMRAKKRRACSGGGLQAPPSIRIGRGGTDPIQGIVFVSKGLHHCQPYDTGSLYSVIGGWQEKIRYIPHFFSLQGGSSPRPAPVELTKLVPDGPCSHNGGTSEV